MYDTIKNLSSSLLVHSDYARIRRELIAEGRGENKKGLPKTALVIPGTPNAYQGQLFAPNAEISPTENAFDPLTHKYPQQNAQVKSTQTSPTVTQATHDQFVVVANSHNNSADEEKKAFHPETNVGDPSTALAKPIDVRPKLTRANSNTSTKSHRERASKIVKKLREWKLFHPKR